MTQGTVKRPPRQWRIRIPGVRRSLGLGDALKTATQAVGVRPCSGCRKRAEALNRRVVFEPAVRVKRRT